MSKYTRISNYYQANFGIVDNVMGGIDRFGVRIGRRVRSAGYGIAKGLYDSGASPKDLRVRLASVVASAGDAMKNDKTRRMTGLVGLGALGLGSAGLAGAGYLGYKAYQNRQNNQQ